MAATKVWKKLRRVEKVGLMALCVVMLLTLGIGGSTVFGSCEKVAGAGSMVVDGVKTEIDPVDYREFVNGYWTVTRILADIRRQEAPKLTDDALEQEYLMHQLAKRAGIEVPDEALRGVIEDRIFTGRETQEFDRDFYRATLEKHRVTQRIFEKAMRARLEVMEYMSMFQYAVDPTMDEIYARFKERNKKYRVEYTWTSLVPFEDQVKAEELTDEELATYYKKVDYRYTVPMRREIEAAYVTLADVSDEEFDALYEKWEDELKVTYKTGLFYWRRQRHLFDDAALEAIQAGADEPADRPEDEPADRPEDEPADDDTPPVPPVDDGADGDDDGAAQEEEPAPGRTPVVGEVPAGAAPAEEPPVVSDAPDEKPVVPELTEKEIYDTYWESLIRKEIFFQNLAKKVLTEARDSKASLEELAKRYGLKYVRTGLLKDEELPGIEGIGFGKLRDEVVKYDDPERHAGHLLPRILPTTDSPAEPLRRGWQVVRIVAIDKAHPSPLEDVIDKVREECRTSKIQDLGIAHVEKLREAAMKEGVEFSALVEERGLELRTLPPFGGHETPPAADKKDLESDDEDVRRRAEQKSRDFTVMTQGPANLGGLRNEDFTAPIVDRHSKSILLIHLLGREDPAAEEMTARDTRTIRTELLRTQIMVLLSGRFSVDQLRERLQFKRPGR